ncbi:hypothetical protein HDG32_001741 [Paraburkholderia sp. CI2]|uniref:hypothetical protein n=1 Tax=unclassified Paraburkholderia TaxID=2615204 RepID=UPI00179AC803|nr:MULTISPECIES: hypothetical protein [unclassified Paraburkholderia]MBB5456552.1 hypothetical protein [Paraburkholderia sp. Cpub6]MBB5465637.1 hypothetical protein [Paraburkholderia sp. CI2]
MTQLAQEEDSLQDFEFLRALAPKMKGVEFSARIASAFFLWPKELFDTEPNRNALASTVQQDLFEGNHDGWKAYAAHVQKKEKWFVTGLPGVRKEAGAESLHDAVEEAGPVEASVTAAPPVQGDAHKKSGWPWAESRSTS